MKETSSVSLLDGANNFRDLGGLKSSDGRVVINFKIFRSDSLDDLSTSDINFLKSHGVKSIIDLRASIELDDEVPRIHSDEYFQVHKLPLSDSWEKWGELTEDERKFLLSRKYSSYVTEAGSNIASAIKIVITELERSNSVVFHCTAGKDRTGVVALILLSLIGINEDEIVADYSKTKIALPHIIEKLATKKQFKERLMTNPPEVYEANEITAIQFLEAFESEFGSSANWAALHGISMSEIDNLRNAVLVSLESEDE